MIQAWIEFHQHVPFILTSSTCNNFFLAFFLYVKKASYTYTFMHIYFVESVFN